ncbi:NAD(P)-dependent alcohol dehydrogenase [Cohnella sp. LGH]|uniref:NAD(P)-dependent alcohol dehydrogenase n=1 Tax=Cohnella sp. LGH TaxID=1619153 RepID=UPI001ADCFCD6|nr:NAD(P)-dependent alcohol dehydrogenase [Cohnella sp. LGH]QTH43449.1 NAD(P)-dependent alcohol dehydrogenase [Cohnella sp. LGH]
MASANEARPAAVPDEMVAAVLLRPFEVRLERRPTPRPRVDEVLIKVMAVGVCGSDVHYYEHGKIGRYIVDRPLVLGHECAGVVAAVGADVTRFAPGDRVAVEPGMTCGRCSACKSGRYNLCPDVRFLATPPVDGAFAQYVAIREDFVFPIPEGVSFERAAMNEPFSVGLHAVRRAGLKTGDTVAILGMGPVGLLAVVAAKACGAARVFVSDVEPRRLDAALKLGAELAVHAGNEDAAEAIRRATGGEGADVSIETAGNPRALRSALLATRRGGAVAVVGLPPEGRVELDVSYLVDNEIDVRGVFRYANTYPLGLSLLADPARKIEALFTDVFPLEETAAALERARANKSGSLKVFVYPNGGTGS